MRAGSARPFVLWLALFYMSWGALVYFGGLWDVVTAHWPIALSMAFGSYFAGSTPMGGGTIGFPMLVLLFDQPAELGRNFGLAVQSVGMVSASIFILSTRRPVEWHLLRPALLGALAGTPFGAAFIAPLAPDLWIKLLFAVVWASFGAMHFIRLRAIVAANGGSSPWHGKDRPIALTVGFVGGIAAAVTGVGIDMLLYAVLVLLYRADLKIAIPTSVILMAFTSLIGITTNILLATFLPASYDIAPAVIHNWLAAAPVVAVGAPFGAFIINRIPRKPTLLIVSSLCIAQFVWTVFKEQVSGWGLVWALGGVLVANMVFHLMFRLGERRCGSSIKAGNSAAAANRALSAAFELSPPQELKAPASPIAAVRRFRRYFSSGL